MQEKKEKREALKNARAALASTDYKIIKAYEYQLAALDAPYDITGLHVSREAIREQIRLLEE